MKKAKAVFFDGMKSMNAWDVDDLTGWTVTDGNQTKTFEELYFKNVAWLYRAVVDRSNMVGRMPFAIRNGETEVDTSAEYKNAIGCMSDPIQLFKKVEQSLAMVGKAFVRLERNPNKYVKNLKYQNPNTITEEYNKKTGELLYYNREANGLTIIIPKEDMLAFYDADYTTEIGGGSSSAAKAALASAGVLFNVDKFLSNFFERGAIKATIFTVEGFKRDEAEKMQSWIDSFIKGVKNAWAGKVLNGDKVNTQVIGEGLESLSNLNLTTERRQNIAAAIGVPESRMWSSAANYATAQQDEKNYLLGTIVPECDLIAGVFNSQLFTAYNKLEGNLLDYDYESLDAFQEDVNAQTEAMGKLVEHGVPLLMAMDIVGMDLTPEQRTELEKIQAEKEKEPDPTEQPIPVVIPERETDDRMQDEIRRWKRKVTKRLKDGKSAACEFESDIIPESANGAIFGSLEGCKTIEDVTDVFTNALEWVEYP